MSNGQKLANLKEAQSHIEALERFHDVHPEVPCVSDAEAIELASAIQDLESQNRKLTSRKQCQMLFLGCEILTELLARERKEELKAARRTKRQSKGIF